MLVAVRPAIAKGIKAGRDLREANTKRVVLAYGEVTGHAHVVLGGKETGRGKGRVEFFEATEGPLPNHAIRSSWKNDRFMFIVPQLCPRDRSHAESAQRLSHRAEYSPEAIRQVAD